ncbi:MAG TPA: DinB family protein [Thermoanaerobaculia bacterium]|nr:DinB family protein [Thermoanaerobaculia bacterium]HQR67843.1 DinB family protein [Thermoanaerobaculia bacterium]
MKIAVLSLAAALALPAAAQGPGTAAPPAAPAANPAVTGLKGPWNRVKDLLVRAAEKMPEENYAFKASPDVRSFGQLVGHVADANFMFAAMAAGEKPAPRDIEKTKTSKADLVAALKESFAAADKAFAQTDADLATATKMFGMDTNRFAVVGLLIGHDWEHYGNLVTYLRIKGVVPPSSEPRPEAAKAPAK